MSVVDFKRIKRRRGRQGLTLTAAAQEAGWTPQKWANIEAGRRPNPRIETLVVVADVLNCRVDYLLDPNWQPPKGKR